MAILTARIKQLLEDQYRHEINNSMRYSVRQSWADSVGMNNAARFFEKEAKGERGHAKKVLDYLNSRNVFAQISPLQYGESDPENFINLFESALQIERDTTEKLTSLASAAFSEGDLQTFFWVSDLITEQTEEENLYQTILDRAKITQNDHLLDVWIGETFL